MCGDATTLFLAPSKIEEWIVNWLDESERLGDLAPIRVLERKKSNTEIKFADENDDTLDRMTLGTKQVEKKIGSNGYVGIFCCLSFCHKLLTAGKTATQRELYYYYKGGDWTPWSSQAECNESIADVASIFNLPRYALGFTTSARGLLAGRLCARRLGSSNWIDFHDDPRTISHEWLTKQWNLQTDARCVLIVEKDGVFQRLVEDHCFDLYPSILVTGCGVPDLPTRACVRKLADLGLPVYALVDWNIWGLGVLLTYKLGSVRLGKEGTEQAVNVRWLGLRSSQIAHLSISEDQTQTINDRDRKRATNLLQSDWIKAKPHWAQEIQDQLDLGKKCEIEALLSGNMDSISEFVEFAITGQDWLE